MALNKIFNLIFVSPDPEFRPNSHLVCEQGCFGPKIQSEKLNKKFYVLTRFLESGQEDDSESENEEFLNPNGTLVGTTENEVFETDANGNKLKVSISLLQTYTLLAIRFSTEILLEHRLVT